MAQEIINVGSAPNDGLGDPIRTAFIKCNDNFTELYSATAGNANLIVNGASNVSIPAANSNVLIGVAGTANVVQITSTGQLVTGTVSATGNITGNYILGNGALLTGLPATYSNANVAAYLPTYSGNVGAGNVSVTGNVTAAFFTGNGAGLTGVVAVANVGSASQLANGTTSFNIPVANGNVVGNVNGATNVYVFTEFGQDVAGYVSATGNVDGGNLHAAGVVSAAGNVRGGNINTAGLVTAAGNVTGGNISTAGMITGGNISTTGNVVAGNVVTTTGTFRLPSFTSLELANISPTPGDMVYNTTVNQVQAWQYDATNTFAWVSLSVSTYQ